MNLPGFLVSYIINGFTKAGWSKNCKANKPIRTPQKVSIFFMLFLLGNVLANVNRQGNFPSCLVPKVLWNLIRQTYSFSFSFLLHCGLYYYLLTRLRSTALFNYFPAFFTWGFLFFLSNASNSFIRFLCGGWIATQQSGSHRGMSKVFLNLFLQMIITAEK